MKVGCFITFEGSEGCGKTTQIKLLAERLVREGNTVCLTREPGGTPVGEQIRHLLKFASAGHGMSHEAEVLLFCANRAEHVKNLIRPALARGEVVLCDRFLDSTTAYQGRARGLPTDLVQAANKLAVGQLIPDITLVLDMDAEQARKRALRRPRPAGIGEDRMESEPPEFYQRVREAYLDLAKENPSRVKIIAASHSRDVVADSIWKEVSHVLNSR